MGLVLVLRLRTGSLAKQKGIFAVCWPHGVDGARDWSNRSAPKTHLHSYYSVIQEQTGEDSHMGDGRHELPQTMQLL